MLYKPPVITATTPVMTAEVPVITLNTAIALSGPFARHNV
jgi:hypothetical protein